MGAEIAYSLNFEIIQCANCGISFGLTKDYIRRRREDGEGFHCPSGHSNTYAGKTEVDRLKRELESERKLKEWAQQDATKARERATHQERRANTFKGHLTRTKNRIAGGVCPCCNRTFQNLANHMKHQHPSYAERS